MVEKRKNEYEPDTLVTPGEVLGEYLESMGMSQVELAMRTGLSKKTINEIIKGKSPITPETALKLERTMVRSAHFWNNLERLYQEDRTRLAEIERLQSNLEWLKRVPVAAMAKKGWIRKCGEKVEQLEEVLRFFGVASPQQWKSVWENHQVVYRQSQRFKAHAESVSAWLRQGEIEARLVACAPFEKKVFRSTLRQIRGMTREMPNQFVPELVRICAAAGVAVVFVPELPKTGVSGATRWLGDRAVIQLSLRYKRDDQLWFTFFHEAGHILKHGRKEVFVACLDLEEEKEDTANSFAREMLIPPAQYRRFIDTWDGRSLAPIMAFADEIGISPGIVVGRVQFDEYLPYSHGNQLKVTYDWKNWKQGAVNP